MVNTVNRDWYVFAYYDSSNTAVFVGMEQEVEGEDMATKYSGCTKLDSSKGYKFSDTEISRVVGAKVIGYGMTRDEADMSVKVARNLVLDCMPKTISENMLKVRFVKEIGVEISTGALEDNSTLADEDLGTNTESVENPNAEELVEEEADQPLVQGKNTEQEDIRLRLEHTRYLILHTLHKNDGNADLAKFYLSEAEGLKGEILALGLTPADALSGPSILAKRSKEELENSLVQVLKYKAQYKFEDKVAPKKQSPVIDTSKLSINDEVEEMAVVPKVASKVPASTGEIKGHAISDEEFNEVVADFTRSLAKRKQDEIDKLMGVQKPHPLDNLEFDENWPPKKTKKLAAKTDAEEDSDLGELDEKLRLNHYMMVLLQVKARRMNDEEAIDRFANKAEALRKQVLALGVSEVQDMADIAVVGRMKNSELKAAIAEVKQAQLERQGSSVPAKSPEEEAEDLHIANNIDREIIKHQKRTGTGTAKERNQLRHKIEQRNQRISELEG